MYGLPTFSSMVRAPQQPPVSLPRTGDTINVSKAPTHELSSSSSVLERTSADSIKDGDIALSSNGNYYIVKNITDRSVDLERPGESYKMAYIDGWVLHTVHWSIRDNLVVGLDITRVPTFKFLGPPEFSAEDVSDTILDIVTDIERSDLPVLRYLSKAKNVPGGHIEGGSGVSPILVIEAKSQAGAIAAYMNWLEDIEEPYQEYAEFLGWDDLNEYLPFFIGKDPSEWPQILVDNHQADLEEEVVEFIRFTPSYTQRQQR